MRAVVSTDIGVASWRCPAASARCGLFRGSTAIVADTDVRLFTGCASTTFRVGAARAISRPRPPDTNVSRRGIASSSRSPAPRRGRSTARASVSRSRVVERLSQGRGTLSHPYRETPKSNAERRLRRYRSMEGLANGRNAFTTVCQVSRMVKNARETIAKDSRKRPVFQGFWVRNGEESMARGSSEPGQGACQIPEGPPQKLVLQNATAKLAGRRNPLFSSVFCASRLFRTCFLVVSRFARHWQTPLETCSSRPASCSLRPCLDVRP